MIQTDIKIEFDPLKTLHVIEANEDLNKIFKIYIPNLSYNMLRTMLRTQTLGSEILEKIREVFESIIKVNSKLLDKYRKVNLKAKPKIPKYYGKRKVLQDLKNHPKSEVDSALLALNELRNVLTRLRNRCIKDKDKNRTKILTSVDYRNIVASVKLLKGRVKPILLKK